MEEIWFGGFQHGLACCVIAVGHCGLTYRLRMEPSNPTLLPATP